MDPDPDQADGSRSAFGSEFTPLLLNLSLGFLGFGRSEIKFV
jgi:hypothetical protein